MADIDLYLYNPHQASALPSIDDSVNTDADADADAWCS